MEMALLAVLLLTVSGCSDEALWVDGAESTCATSGLECAVWFCPTCPFAGACDAACGYCCDVRDCRGACLDGDACNLAELGYERCAEWIGNGCCEDGLGYSSDAGIRLDFNCREHGFDGGDCEAPVAVVDVAPLERHPWCVVLTATICPAQGMTHTVRRDAKVRREDYARALRRWEESTMLPIAMVENSGANLSALRTAAPRVQFVSWHDADSDAHLGKGHGEYRALAKALDTMHCERVLKVTGRYFVQEMDAVLASVDTRARLVVQSTPSPWTLWDGVFRSEVIGFDPSLLHLVFSGQDETQGRPLERTLFLAAKQILKEAGEDALAFFPPLSVDATINAEHSHTITIL